MSLCFTAGFESEAGGVFASVTASLEIEACAGYGEEYSESVAETTAQETSWDTSVSQGMEDSFYVPDAPPSGTPDAGIIQAHGVHLWQWQWTIIEGEATSGQQKKIYEAKANSHYLFSPNDPDDGQPKRPCCFPGQEYSLWYPFNCRSTAGLLPGAGNAAHCRVGQPGSITSHIEQMSLSAVAQWLSTLGLGQDYTTRVSQEKIDGPALSELAKMVTQASVASGDDDSTNILKLVKETFNSKMGDAYKIMAGLVELYNTGS